MEEELFLPSFIWRRIINIAYQPLNRGWDNYLWKIATVSKRHNRAVMKLFTMYKKNPVFPNTPYKNYLHQRALTKYLLKDANIIETGFLIRNPPKNMGYRSSPPIEFSFKNIINQKFFTDTKSRYLVARKYIETANNTSIETKNPIIVIPYTDCDKTVVRGVLVVADNRDFTINRFHCNANCDDIFKINVEEQRNFILRIVQYITKTTDPIPNNIEKFVQNFCQWHNSLCSSR